MEESPYFLPARALEMIHPKTKAPSVTIAGIVTLFMDMKAKMASVTTPSEVSNNEGFHRKMTAVTKAHSPPWAALASR